MAKNPKNGGKIEVAEAEQVTVEAGASDAAQAPAIDPEVAARIAQLRSHVRESFGKVVMAMMMLPRYRQQTLADLQQLVLEPLMRDRVAIAERTGERALLEDTAGIAIWASVSEEADARIRDQVRGGTWPLRLRAEDWNSGNINWLIDVIAPDQRSTASVIANFKQVVKDGALRLHPVVARLVDEETLGKLGAQRLGGDAPETAAPSPNAPASEAVN